LAPKRAWPGIVALALAATPALLPAGAAERAPVRGDLHITVTVPARPAAPAALKINGGTSPAFALCLNGATGMLAGGQPGLALEAQGGCTYRLHASAAANFSQPVTFVMVTQ
jgi:hypothetical protein